MGMTGPARAVLLGSCLDDCSAVRAARRLP